MQYICRTVTAQGGCEILLEILPIMCEKDMESSGTAFLHTFTLLTRGSRSHFELTFVQSQSLEVMSSQTLRTIFLPKSLAV